MLKRKTKCKWKVEKRSKKSYGFHFKWGKQQKHILFKKKKKKKKNKREKILEIYF